MKVKRLTSRQVRKLAVTANQAKRDAFTKQILPVISKLRAKGWTLGQVAAELNRLGRRTRTGEKNWTPANVSRIICENA
ncbi:MAG: recombinase family protein [Gemmataceae bacterium]|nr:recombinase family protein [Gemmataceae bacterium]